MAIQLFKELIEENGHLEIPEGVRKILCLPILWGHLPGIRQIDFMV